MVSEVSVHGCFSHFWTSAEQYIIVVEARDTGIYLPHRNMETKKKNKTEKYQAQNLSFKNAPHSDLLPPNLWKFQAPLNSPLSHETVSG